MPPLCERDDLKGIKPPSSEYAESRKIVRRERERERCRETKFRGRNDFFSISRDESRRFSYNAINKLNKRDLSDRDNGRRNTHSRAHNESTLCENPRRARYACVISTKLKAMRKINSHRWAVGEEGRRRRAFESGCFAR